MEMYSLHLVLLAMVYLAPSLRLQLCSRSIIEVPRLAESRRVDLLLLLFLSRERSNVSRLQAAHHQG
jgi:hypothetical protein